MPTPASTLIGRTMKTCHFSTKTWTSILVSLFHGTSSRVLSTAPFHSVAASFISHRPTPKTGRLLDRRHYSTLPKRLDQPLATSGSSPRYFSSMNGANFEAPSFKAGDKIQVEVTSFGPLGASVSVVGFHHGPEVDLLPVDAEPYGTGLILQQEIAYFRQARGNVDVVRGEVLQAYVLKIREEDGKLDIGLRNFGGKAKTEEVSAQILERLQSAPDGTLSIGDKSPPAEINKVFPGVSKAVFKKAVGALYKKGLVSPSTDSIALAKK